MENEQNQDIKDFEAWWDNEGSSPHKSESIDCEEAIHEKCKEAWLNGAFKARELYEKKAHDEYMRKQKYIN